MCKNITTAQILTHHPIKNFIFVIKREVEALHSFYLNLCLIFTK